MEQKKVLFLSAANSIHTVKWVNSLSKDFEVHLVYCSNHKPNIDTIHPEVKLYELKYKAPLGYYFNCIELRRLYKKIKADIINVHYASGYGTLARISKIRLDLLSVWGSDVYEFPNESRIKKRILEKNITYAKNIASTSKIMAEELKKQVPKLKKEIFITPFGVDIDKFKKNEIRKEDNKFKIGNVKTLNNDIYGIDIGILAIKYLIEKLIKNKEKELANSIVFEIYGDGIDKNNIEKLIEANNLENIVFLKGKIPNAEVPKVLNNLDVFCITSNKESFGVSVVEAMACEVPVVATNADGFMEVMKDGETGYIVEKRNTNEIAEALEKILRNKKLKVDFGKNGRKKVIEEYDWKNNVKTMVSIYEKIQNNR